MEKDLTSPISKKIEITLLFAFYGPLLTAHQQKVLTLSNEEDLSLSEIALQIGVSRQGVHDILSRGIKQLYYFEQQLGMYQRFSIIQEKLGTVVELLEQVETKNGQDQLIQSINLLNGILADDEEEENGF